MLKTFCQYADGDDSEGCQNAVNDVVPAGEAFLVEVLSDGVDEMFHCWDGFGLVGRVAPPRWLVMLCHLQVFLDFVDDCAHCLFNLQLLILSSAFNLE